MTNISSQGAHKGISASIQRLGLNDTSYYNWMENRIKELEYLCMTVEECDVGKDQAYPLRQAIRAGLEYQELQMNTKALSLAKVAIQKDIIVILTKEESDLIERAVTSVGNSCSKHARDVIDQLREIGFEKLVFAPCKRLALTPKALDLGKPHVQNSEPRKANLQTGRRVPQRCFNG